MLAVYMASYSFFFSKNVISFFFLSPVTYCVEGMRSALLGGVDFLPVSVCTSALVLICSVLMWLTYTAVRDRLDIVMKRAHS